mmetsp:Transcript_11385/g.22363  ORF Transcript_11385/g.22363 Transcript_11385/m.22363 type:complete len:286 (+) Transcript_11385:94-951(+)
MCTASSTQVLSPGHAYNRLRASMLTSRGVNGVLVNTRFFSASSQVCSLDFLSMGSDKIGFPSVSHGPKGGMKPFALVATVCPSPSESTPPLLSCALLSFQFLESKMSTVPCVFLYIGCRFSNPQSWYVPFRVVSSASVITNACNESMCACLLSWSFATDNSTLMMYASSTESPSTSFCSLLSPLHICKTFGSTCMPALSYFASCSAAAFSLSCKTRSFLSRFLSSSAGFSPKRGKSILAATLELASCAIRLRETSSPIRYFACNDSSAKGISMSAGGHSRGPSEF